MREILFRGQTASGEWIEGDLFINNRNNLCFTYIRYPVNDISYSRAKVMPETVGQYTGLTDKNGKKIFEGDIVNEYDMPETISNTGIVHWNELVAGWCISQTRTMYNHQYMSYEIIGNIHDNPELLEGGAE